MYELTYRELPNLDAYLERIGYTGSREPTLETLNALIYAHQCTVPFETLDCCDYHLPVSLSVEHLYEKIVEKRRGGYCFELNGIFLTLLRALGYNAWSCMCRVAANFDTLRPIKHRGIMVRLDGRLYYCDVGLGGSMPPFAVALDGGRQTEMGETFWVEALDAEGWYLVKRLSGKGLHDDGSVQGAERNVVIFSTLPMLAEDFEAYSYQCWAFPDSRFVTIRMANLRTPEGFIKLENNSLTVCENGSFTVQEIPEADIPALLKEQFGLEKCEYTC